MSKSGEIVLTTPAHGVFHEGPVSGDTLYPGMCAEVTADDIQGGRPTWQAYSGATAARALLAIALPDFLRGRTKSDLYADGDRGFFYVPRPGDELNLRVDSPVGTGTAADIAPGTLLALQSGGMFATTTTASEAVAVVSEDFVDDTDEVAGTVQAIVLGSN